MSRSSSSLGRLCTVEVDSWFLPDTRGVSYGTAHVKSTIVPQMLDRPGRRLGYFHNAGYFELEGDDFDGVFRLGGHAEAAGLPPYVEVIRLDGIRRNDPELASRVVALTRRAPRPAVPATTRSPGWAGGWPTTCPGWPSRTSTPSTCTRSEYAGSAAPPPSWPPTSSDG